ncbi:hypothetical protein MTO96_002963 [Rhipicephalus appendiculatus]
MARAASNTGQPASSCALAAASSYALAYIITLSHSTTASCLPARLGVLLSPSRLLEGNFALGVAALSEFQPTSPPLCASSTCDTDKAA